MELLEEIQNKLFELRTKPNKRLSQNFIKNKQTIETLVQKADLTQKDTVLEIGPGLGFLTRKLATKSKVIAIEKDLKLFKSLQKEMPNIKLIQGDVLTEKIPNFNKLVCFPPYHISKEICYFMNNKKPKLSVMVFQSEFAEKLSAEPGLKNYNALSVITQYNYKIELVNSVSPDSFYPKPETFSTIVLFTKKKPKNTVTNEEQFKKFVKEIFRYKNKNLSNALAKSEKKLGKINREKIKKTIKEMKLEKQKVMQTEVEEFTKLFNQIF